MRNNKIKEEAEKKLSGVEGLLRTKQILALGIHPRTLYQLRDEGRLIELARGVYQLAGSPIAAELDLSIVAARVEQAIICLISALAFHHLTTEIPHEVYIALPGPGTKKGKQPQLDYPPIRVFRFSGQALTEGIEEHPINGVKVRIYNAAKSVADSFKFRHQIGIDVAIEALKEYRRQKEFSVSELLKYAKVCRVEKIIMPYIEALL